LSDKPFSLASDIAYRRWREDKLHCYPQSAQALHVQLSTANIGDADRKALLELIRKTNMVIYALPDAGQGDKNFVRRLGQRLGLRRLDNNLCADNDAITSLQVMDTGRHRGYIPYSNRRLSWHTDGYYNLPEQAIRAIIMHCVRDAAEGGENLLLDHEIAYIQLRDRNPAYIEALMRADVMTIPANVEDGKDIRAEQSGPVFSLLPGSGHLHMRFSARGRNIVWRDDTKTCEALACLTELLNPNNPYIIKYRLKPGEGIICNNVLHSRTGFTDDEAGGHRRLLYRARYYERIANTDINQE
jgi:hypothetical protein